MEWEINFPEEWFQDSVMLHIMILKPLHFRDTPATPPSYTYALDVSLIHYKSNNQSSFVSNSFSYWVTP